MKGKGEKWGKGKGRKGNNDKKNNNRKNNNSKNEEQTAIKEKGAKGGSKNVTRCKGQNGKMNTSGSFSFILKGKGEM